MCKDLLSILHSFREKTFCPIKRLNSKDKLVWLMNTEEKSVLTTIATFILKNMK